MSIDTKLLALNQVKSDIKTAIEAKGVSLTDIAFTDYDTKIGEISGSSEVTFGSQKTCNFTYPSWAGTIIGTPIILGTTKPASPVLSITITSDMLPTMSGDTIAALEWFAEMTLGFQNLSATTRTISYQVDHVRGETTNSSILSGTSGTSTAGYEPSLCFSMPNLYNAQVGDVFNFYLWSVGSSSDVTLERYGTRLFPTNFRPMDNINSIIGNVGFVVSVNSFTNFSLGGSYSGFAFPNNGSFVLPFLTGSAFTNFTLTGIPVLAETNNYGVIYYANQSEGNVEFQNRNGTPYTMRTLRMNSFTWKESTGTVVM